MSEIPYRTLEDWEQNKEEAQELYDTRELKLATRVKIEQALGLREKPSEEQVKLFNKRLLWTNYNKR